MKDRCTWTKDDGWQTSEARPCPRTHCAMRGTCPNHVDVAVGEHTCPSCVGKIRTTLTRVVETVALMDGEAEHKGVESEAADLAGPSANLVVHKWRLVNAAKSGQAVEEIDMLDPYSCLATYEDGIRFCLGHDQERPVSPTLSEAASYLDWSLTDLARDPEYLRLMEELAADSRRLLAYLEGVLRDSRTPERGAPCPTCSDATSDDEDRHAPRLVKRYAEHDKTGASDRWVCPDDNAHWWYEGDYRLRVSAKYLSKADRLTASQMQAEHSIKPGSLRGWASKGLVRKRGKDQQQRTLYDVADAKKCADGHAVVEDAC